MPRTYRTTLRLLIFTRLTLTVLCLIGLGATVTQAITPCGAGSTAGFRSRTLSISQTGVNVDPSSIGVGDFNNDGRADVAMPVGNSLLSQTNFLLIFLGNATNGLDYFTTVGIIRNPSAIAVTEFNNDGKLDLIVSNWNFVQTLVGDGNGGFSPVATYTVDSTSLAVGDFNSDGKQDIAAAPVFAVPGRVSILMGFGTGTYAAPVDTPTGDRPADIVAVDVNGDNKLDLLTANGTNGLSVMLNNGTGSFGFPTNFATGLARPYSIAVGDFNNDTKLDVIVANGPEGTTPFIAPSMALLLGNGTGSFGAAANFDFGINFQKVVARDFTGDGNLDVAALQMIQNSATPVADTGTVVVLAGDGLGDFDVASTNGVNHNPRSIGAGDFNNDGRLDIFATNAERSFNGFADVSILLGKCNQPHIQTDFDGDGRVDFAVWRPTDGFWRIKQSSDNVLRQQQWGLGSLGDKPVPGDYDGDGKSDLAVFRPSQGTWYILNSFDSSFRATPWGTSGDIPVPGDYDGDQRTDVAVFRPSTGVWYVLRSSDSTFYGVGFGLGTDEPVPGDYDGDGNTDIAVWRPGNGFWYQLNSSDGTFHATSWGTNGDIPVPVDLDGDSLTDYAVYRPSNNAWYLFRPDAPSQYWQISVGTNADTPTPADYDGDGMADFTMWRPSLGVFAGTKSFTGQPYSSDVIGVSGDIPVSTPYAQP